jgi:hypothetical protein
VYTHATQQAVVCSQVCSWSFKVQLQSSEDSTTADKLPTHPIGNCKNGTELKILAKFTLLGPHTSHMKGQHRHSPDRKINDQHIISACQHKMFFKA